MEQGTLPSGDAGFFFHLRANSLFPLPYCLNQKNKVQNEYYGSILHTSPTSMHDLMDPLPTAEVCGHVVEDFWAYIQKDASVKCVFVSQQNLWFGVRATHHTDHTRRALFLLFVPQPAFRKLSWLIHAVWLFHTCTQNSCVLSFDSIQIFYLFTYLCK